MSPESLELALVPPSSPPQSVTDSTHDGDEDSALVSSRHEFSLPPVDRGKNAWFFLAAGFFIEALTWGFPFSFGVFQEHYSTHKSFSGSSQIPTIGTCALGIMYLDVPLIMGLQRLNPRFSRCSPVIGLLLMCVAMAASSFSQTPAHLIATQGVLYAIGGSICYCPCILYLDQWFVERKGLAYGIMCSGTGVAGFVLPLLIEHLLGRYGFRTTLRIWAVSLFVLAMPLAYFIKPRLPPTATTHIQPFKLGFVLKPTFLLHQAANICQALGFFLPGIYLPTYARAIGAGPIPAAMTIQLINVAAVFGSAVMGLLTDHFHVTTCLLISAAGATLGTSAWPGIMRQITSEPAKSDRGTAGATFDPTMVIGILSTGRGIGSVVSGPLSQALIKDMPWQGRVIGGYGTGYGPMITFTGATAVMSGIPFLWGLLGWMG